MLTQQTPYRKNKLLQNARTQTHTLTYERRSQSQTII